jgi:purine-binding chemotaxis protein CheW
LAFKLGNEEYAMDILHVQEIRSYEQPTRMANTPAFIKGLVNLRGVIVPIIDMRIKFNLEQVNYDTFTVVIVLKIGSQIIGMVVDGVSDVMTLTPEQLRPVPKFSSAVSSEHILAIGSVDKRMLILLDIERLMTSAEMCLVSQSIH